jgi:hypothetical protein
MNFSTTVMLYRFAKSIHSRRSQLKINRIQRTRLFGCTSAVLVILVIIVVLAVMQKGKQFND